jgi:TatD DNase family protein
MDDPSVALIGEIGLDKRGSVPYDVQMNCLHQQLEMDIPLAKPVIVHCVKSFNDILPLRRTYDKIPVWIIHGFRGNRQLAKQCLDAGFWLSFGANFQPEALAYCPVERLFLETDETGNIKQLYAVAAAIKGITVDLLQEQIIHKLANLTGDNIA